MEFKTWWLCQPLKSLSGSVSHLFLNECCFYNWNFTSEADLQSNLSPAYQSGSILLHNKSVIDDEDKWCDKLSQQYFSFSSSRLSIICRRSLLNWKAPTSWKCTWATEPPRPGSLTSTTRTTWLVERPWREVQRLSGARPIEIHIVKGSVQSNAHTLTQPPLLSSHLDSFSFVYQSIEIVTCLWGSKHWKTKVVCLSRNNVLVTQSNPQTSLSK